MKFTAEINIMPKKEILDPQGKAVTGSMKNIGLPEIENIRIGKRITLTVDAPNAESAREKVELACSQLLVNKIMESYTIEISA